MSDMKCPIKCPICGEMLQKYGEVDPDTGTSIVLGANCPKCGIGNSDIKLWQELIRTRKALDKGMEHITGLNNMIESWLNLINSDLDQETKLHILKSAISAYVENKGGDNDDR